MSEAVASHGSNPTVVIVVAVIVVIMAVAIFLRRR